MDRALGAVAGFTTRHAGLTLAIWIAVATTLNLAVPQLENVVKRDSSAFVPSSADAIKGFKAMERAFGSGHTNSYVYLTMARASGLTDADTAYYHRVAVRLERSGPVTAVQDLSGDPRTLRSVTSHDGKARYLVIGLSGQTGAPTGTAQVDRVRDIAHDGVPRGLDLAVTGTSATVADTTHEIESKLVVITIVTVLLIAAILQFFYRSLVVTGLGLTIIGLSLATARAAVAWFGLHVFAISTFTGSFITGVVVGASTDYFIFTLGRYYDQRREGVPPIEAARAGASRISPVIIGSGVTVILANAAAIVAHVAFFRTTGPAISVAIAAALSISLTASPALIALAASRGRLEPPPERAAAYWQRTAARVLAQPSMMFTTGLVLLIGLAALAPFVRLEYDQTRNQPHSSESNRGYRLIGQHFPVDEVAPEFLVVTADHDMRTTRDLAALEQMAVDVARVHGVAQVRGVTRPDGRPLTKATLTYQAGVVGRRLDTSAAKIGAGQAAAEQLAAGAGRLSGGAAQVAAGADAAAVGARRLLDGLGDLQAGVGGLSTGTDQASAGSAMLQEGTTQLADGLDFAVAQTAIAVTGLGQAYIALQLSATCALEPICSAARAGVGQIYLAERDQLLPGLRQAAAAARLIADGQTSLSDGLRQLDAGLARARSGADQLTAGQGTLSHGLIGLATGAGQVADGSGRIAEGTRQSAAAARELHDGLAAAARYLREMHDQAGGSPTAAGFFIPAAFLDNPDFAATSGLLLAQDGRTARYMILGDTWPFQRASITRSERVLETAKDSLATTALKGATVRSTGQAAFNRDLQRLSQIDFLRTAAVALVVVLLILLLLLRAPLVAAFLVATVILSYGAAIGIGVLIWQELLHADLDWTMPTIAFILLVSVGADYNLLLMKRVQEFADAGAGARRSIAQAVASTGSVITTAGIIFAASMFALVVSGIVAMSQMGTMVGIGLLLDTFVVRTLVVPSGAALMGDALWWPRRTAAAQAR